MLKQSKPYYKEKTDVEAAYYTKRKKGGTFVAAIKEKVKNY
jgi:hypothetical protein